MSAPELRPYQLKILADIEDAFRAGHRRPCVVAPTGSGKTVMFAELIRGERQAGGRALALAHRRELITQTSRKLAAARVLHGIIMPGEPSWPMLDVQVASVPTLLARGIRRETMALPPADLGIIDEAHHTPAASYLEICAAYPDTRWVGFTATPERGDGRGLGGFFDVLIEGPQVAELIELGHLVGTRTYAPANPDLAGVETRQGDYVTSQLEDRMDRAKLVGDIVQHWHKLGEGRKTVVFAVSVGHSVHIRDAFLEAGISAAHIDGKTPREERDATLAQLAAGEIRVVTNCMVLTEGWDCPDVGCIVLARPTKKMGLYRQMVGRGLRPAPGKADCIVIDHAGAVHRHGFAEDHVEWTLDPDNRAVNASAAAHGAPGEPGSRIVECSNCGALRTAGEPCGACGFKPEPRPRYVPHVDGDLGLVDRQRRVKPADWGPAERQHFYQQLAGIATEHPEWRPSWPSMKYRERFDEWPPWSWRDLEPLEPTPEVRAWVRSRYIAWRKSREAA
jgi:superfamily II DNA or RNA helicase